MYYVSMTDTFLSGWGMAKGKEAKFINICDTLKEAKIVKENGKYRKDEKKILIYKKMPKYNEKLFYVQIKTKKEMPNWYEKDFFKR